MLTGDKVEEVLIRSKAPTAIVARLREQSFPNEKAVLDAVAAERKYIAESVGSGLPHGVGGSSPSAKQFDQKRLEESLSAVDAKYGLAPVRR